MAPEAFAEEIDRAFDMIRWLPSVGEPVVHSTVIGVRRLLLGRVHYHIYYAPGPTGDTVDVLALWHTSRGEPPEL